MNIISCSRRTDIPARYPQWLENCLVDRQVTFSRPRVGTATVSLKPVEIFSLVLWSKDFAPVLQRPALMCLLTELNPFFHFTITGLGGSILEPHVPGWQESVEVMAALVQHFGAERINWRFDPLVFWQENGSVSSNRRRFREICQKVAVLGVASCTISFAHWYAKSSRRALKRRLEFVDPPWELKIEAVQELVLEAESAGVSLRCCADESLKNIPGLKKARCIDGKLLSNLRADGARVSLAKDRAQRPECGCVRSIDIGSYRQRCSENPCIYCYAN